MRIGDLARLSLRNLARNRRRTVLSLAIVAAGTAAIILTAGFVRFSFDGLREAMIHGGLGHLEVADAAAVAARPGALDRAPSAALGETRASWHALRVELEELPHVVAVGANVHLMGIVQTPDGRSASFVGAGVEPARETLMGFADRLREGQQLPLEPPAPGADRALLATGLAATLGVEPGDRVTLLAQSESGMLDALDVVVAGVVTTGVAELDSRWLKLPLVSAQRLVGSERISSLLIGLDDTRATDTVLAAARRVVADRPLAVTPWHDRAPFYSQVRGLYLGIFAFLGTVVGVLVVLAASNTLVMAVLERVREIGSLRAIGTSRGQIAALLLAEAAWLGLFGAVAGGLLGLVGIGTINALSLRMPPPPGAVDPIDLQLAVVPGAFLGAGALMITVLLLAALLPALRAARLEIIDALGHA